MQSLGHACIFCTSNPRGHTTFFAAYVVSGNSLSFGRFFLNIFSTCSNPLSGTSLSAFHYNNSSTVPSFVMPDGFSPFVGEPQVEGVMQYSSEFPSVKIPRFVSSRTPEMISRCQRRN